MDQMTRRGFQLPRRSDLVEARRFWSAPELFLALRNNMGPKDPTWDEFDDFIYNGFYDVDSITDPKA